MSSLLIFNSNYVNNQKAQEKLNQEKSQLFNQIISNRYLEESENNTKTDKVCSRGSESLIEYYKTGDLSEIELEEGNITCEDKNEGYMKALINIVKNLAGGGDGDTDKDTGTNNQLYTPSEDEVEGRRNLLGESMNIDGMKDDLIDYGKHLLPILIFFVIGILCIPGWLICCFCCCCNCCCCCCCKKPGCKIPCFIFTYLFYALVVVVCIYGLTKSNSIYVGLADTECSLLKFFDQILDGETKQELPRWAGISGINDILDDLYFQINDMKNGTKTEMDNQMGYIENKKGDFIGFMNTSGDKFFDSNGKYKDIYSKVYNFNIGSTNINGRYALDIIKMFGKYDSTSQKYKPENSVLDIWEQEYSLVSRTADEYMGQAHDGFSQILDDKVDDLLGNFNDGRKQLDEIKSSFDDIKNDIGNIIIDYSELIDDYGKLGFKLVFGVLALINIAIAVFMLLICICSGKSCTNCCCCRCICKLFTHLLWNILALLMIIVFLVGFLIALVGQVGSDAMSIISYVVSADNTDNILLDQLGDAKPYLDRCINGDGQIVEELGLDTSQINSFDDIRTAEQKIEETKNEFKEKKQFVTYNIYKDKLLSRNNLTDNSLSLVHETVDLNNLDSNDLSKVLNFDVVLSQMNEFIKNDPDSYTHKETWDKTSTVTDKICKEGDDDFTHSDGTELKLNPKYCKPYYRDWIENIGSAHPKDYIKNSAQVISDTITFIKNAMKDSDVDEDYLKILNLLKDKYELYLDQYIDTLDFFNTTIKRITSKLNEYSGNNQTFSFIQCNFIGTNLKIVLKYLKSALGKDIYTVGICFLIVGCSLLLSISSTILLIVVINTDIDKNKEEIKEKDNIPEYRINSEGRVIRYTQY
ncbi:MAG: hypothetical protein J6O56_00245 [Bacilli bacterium]|nr:hypothetical protein [Bacilli bacterium]